jgi:hypothetical protein
VSGKQQRGTNPGFGPASGHLPSLSKDGKSQFEPREAAMSSEIITPDPQPTAASTFDTERGLLIAVLAMVILGVVGVFLVTA